MTLTKLGISWQFVDVPWQDSYLLAGTAIRDAAVLWRANSHVRGEFTCLSFQHRKHLSLGRGGMILCDSDSDANALRRMAYDGRDPQLPWAEQDINTLGYHYYMTPETAALGMQLLPVAMATQPLAWSWCDYPDLRTMELWRAQAI